jgi:hypothetical protein
LAQEELLGKVKIALFGSKSPFTENVLRARDGEAPTKPQCTKSYGFAEAARLLSRLLFSLLGLAGDCHAGESMIRRQWHW